MISESESFSFPEVRVVEASAGSGKTFALAKRYVQLLLHPSLNQTPTPFRNILALTFTNKAAHEMKERILLILRRIALGETEDPAVRDLLKSLEISEDQARGRAFTIMEGLMHHFNFFQVQTIDTFINTLLAGCAWKLGLTAHFRIRTDSASFLQYSLDQLLDEAKNDDALLELFDLFLHQYLYLENRSGWFPGKDMLSILKAMYQEHNHYGRRFLPGPVAAENLIKNKKVILEHIHHLREKLPKTTNATFRKSIEGFLDSHTKSFDVDSLSASFARESPPLNKGTPLTDDLMKLWTKIRGTILQVCEQEALGSFNSYIRIFEETDARFQRRAVREDVVFLEQLNLKAARLFQDDRVSVEELYYRLAMRFRHYLLDEFQDTSRMQWTNLETLVDEALATGGTLFYVGDRKQAIYGFRGGDVALFERLKLQYHEYVRATTLTRNWRSHRAIVEWNNRIFSVENLTRFCRLIEQDQSKDRIGIRFHPDDFSELEKVYASARQECRGDLTQGCVRVRFVDRKIKEDREEEIYDQLLELLPDLTRRFAFGDIAVLTRNNREVETVTAWFLENGIPVESERTSNLKEHPLILELMDFLRFLDSPIDNVSFGRFITGRIFTTAAGIAPAETREWIMRLRGQPLSGNDRSLYMAYRENAPENWDRLIEPFFSRVGLFPLYELLVTIFHRFDILRAFPGTQGFFMHLLELVKAREEEFIDLRNFLAFFDNLEGADLYVHVARSDTVRVTTIHKAKGLQFPVVIYPFLGMNVKVGTSGDNKQSFVVRGRDDGVRLLRMKRKYYEFSDDLYSIYAEEYKKALMEEINTIYVALTRPQCEMHVFVPSRCGAQKNLVNFLIPEDMFEAGGPEEYPREREVREEPPWIAPPLYRDWINRLDEELVRDEDITARDARREGDVLHDLLSRIVNLAEGNPEDQISKAGEQTRLVFPRIPDLADFLEVVTAVLRHPDLRRFFFVAGADIFTEKEIMTPAGFSRRVDRMIVFEDRVEVIDFKLTRGALEENSEQLRGYMDLAQAMYPGREVSGFLVYLKEPGFQEVSRTPLEV